MPAVAHDIALTQKTGKTLRERLMQSTIYDQHAARRVKTLAKQDDPRPAPVRVLSGLPGFSIFFPPYQPQQQPSSSSSPVTSAVNASESGQFRLESITTTTNNNDIITYPQSDKEMNKIHSTSSNLLAVVMAAGSGALLSESVLGKRKCAGSPFSSGMQPTIRSGGMPVLRNGGAVAVALMSSRVPIPFTLSNGLIHAPTTPFAAMVARATSISFVFGTKAAVERSLRLSSTETPWLVSLLASGTAGALQAVSRSCMGESIVLGREVMATTAYFSTYEIIRGLFQGDASNNSDSSTHKKTGRHYNPLVIAMAGGAAGSASVLVRGVEQTVVAGGMIPRSLLASQTLGYSVLRAAPYHALLFLGYETARGLLGDAP